MLMPLVKSNILMMNPLSTANQAYSLLIQDEKQREIHTKNHSLEFAFMVSNQSFTNLRTRNTEEKFKERFEGRKTNQICSYCKKPGHSVEKYYRIVGFPSNFKFTKSRKFQGGIHSNATMTEENAMHSMNGGEINTTGKARNHTRAVHPPLPTTSTGQNWTTGRSDF